MLSNSGFVLHNGAQTQAATQQPNLIDGNSDESGGDNRTENTIDRR